CTAMTRRAPRAVCRVVYFYASASSLYSVCRQSIPSTDNPQLVLSLPFSSRTSAIWHAQGPAVNQWDQGPRSLEQVMKDKLAYTSAIDCRRGHNRCAMHALACEVAI